MTDVADVTGVKDGWYPDPAGEGTHRWWSAGEWTEHVVRHEPEVVSARHAAPEPVRAWESVEFQPVVERVEPVVEPAVEPAVVPEAVVAPTPAPPRAQLSSALVSAALSVPQDAMPAAAVQSGLIAVPVATARPGMPRAVAPQRPTAVAPAAPAAPYAAPAAPYVAPPAVGSPAYGTPTWTPGPRDRIRNRAATSSLLLSILLFPAWVVTLGIVRIALPVPMIVTVVALVVAIVSVARSNRIGSGLVRSVISLVLAALSTLLVIPVLLALIAIAGQGGQVGQVGSGLGSAYSGVVATRISNTLHETVTCPDVEAPRAALAFDCSAPLPQGGYDSIHVTVTDAQGSFDFTSTQYGASNGATSAPVAPGTSA